jgi:hypothetical protein
VEVRLMEVDGDDAVVLQEYLRESSGSQSTSADTLMRSAR